MTKLELLAKIQKTYEQTVDVRYIDRDFDVEPNDKEKALKAVYDLVEEGELMLVTKYKYITTKKNGYLKGKIYVAERGFGFFEEEIADKSLKQPDLFVTPRNLNGAMHGDIVLAKKTKLQNKDGAVVFTILKRAFSQFVGVYKQLKHFGFVVPDDSKLWGSGDVFINNENNLYAKDGQKVFVKIINYNNDRGRVEGKIVQILGMPHHKGVDILSVIKEKGLHDEFLPQAEKEAKAVEPVVDLSKHKDRKKFENCGVITIDGDDARDFDDAIHIEQNGDITTLYVHIADVSHYVTEGSGLDEEAYRRGTSVYFPDMVLHMLPPEISTNTCSLKPNVWRLTLTAAMQFDKNGEMIHGDVYKSVVKSEARLNYEQAQKMMDGDKETASQFERAGKQLPIMALLAKQLEQMRTKRGGIDFDIPEAYIKVDKNGKTVYIVQRERLASHKLIESFMIAANEFIAKKFFLAKMPILFRVHDKPEPIKVEQFFDFCASIGEKISKKSTFDNKVFQQFLMQIEGKPYANTITKLALRTMQKARYSEQCLPHFGLASTHYMHFTSPIRRYPDLLSHRIIGLYLEGKLVEGNALLSRLREFAIEAALKTSLCEKIAEEAEREVVDIKKAEYMEQFVGETFSATICGVHNFGVFVELENTCEGLIRIENLKDKFFEFVEKQMMLRGSSKTYKLGDKIFVKLVSSSARDRQMEFIEIKEAPKKEA